jgi:hypothetical protein
MGLAVLLTRATYSIVVQIRENKDDVREQSSQKNNASTMERRKQELRNKKNSTLRKFGEKLKPQTLERKSNFREGESYSSQQSKTAVKKLTAEAVYL